MEPKESLNQEIINLTTEITNNYPELVKYLEELTISIPDTGQFDIQDLQDYRNTLKSMIQNYKNENKIK